MSQTKLFIQTQNNAVCRGEVSPHNKYRKWIVYNNIVYKIFLN